MVVESMIKKEKQKPIILRKIKSAFRKWRNLSWGVRIFLSLFFVFFLFEAVVNFYPFLWTINNSLKTFEEFSESPTTAITSTWAFSNYLKVFDQFTVNGTVRYAEMLWNSVWQTGVFLVVNLSSSMFVAYALAKFRFPCKNLLYAILIFVQTIPIIGTGAAAYKLRFELGMINNPALIWICWASGFDYSAFVLYGTFQGVSGSYSESAELDGANEFDILFKIIFPQVFPAMLALMVTNFVSRWNDYSFTQVNLNNYPNLAYGMFLYQTASNWSADGKVVYYASLIMSAVPGVLLYACFQGLIINNLTVGGLKG